MRLHMSFELIANGAICVLAYLNLGDASRLPGATQVARMPFACRKTKVRGSPLMVAAVVFWAVF